MKNVRDIRNEILKQNSEYGSGGSVALMIVLAILVIIVFASWDFLQFRYGNNFKVYNNTTSSTTDIGKFIAGYSQYKGTVNSYSETMRLQDLDFTGSFKVLEVNMNGSGECQVVAEVGYHMKEGHVYYDDCCRFSIYMDDKIEPLKYKVGDYIDITAKFNLINDNWIVLTNGKVVK